MSLPSENLDFSGLFKLDVLVHLDIVCYSFYEVCLKKFLALSSDQELVLIYIDSQGERLDHNQDWDFADNPVYCMCFEPSGTWLLVISEEKLLLVPYLPLFDSKINYDMKWSLNSVTVLPLGMVPSPVSVVWWLTKESENILIIGCKSGVIVFYSLESQTSIGETKVPGEITELQICFDDSLDLLTLLISSSKTQQWKLVLEHRSVGYNWLLQTSLHNNNKKEGFMNYIKQLSKDKITLFIQGGSKDDNKTTVEYVLKPIEYLPLFRKGSNNWALTSQYVNGRHFLTAFELNDGTLILESPEENTPSRTLRPRIKKDGHYIQGLWSQRLIYLLREKELEVHSASFSIIQGEGLVGTKREFSELWSAEVIGNIMRAYLMTTKDPPNHAARWKEPTFLCDLQLPRFNIESCLVLTTKGAFVLNTVCEPTEWLVGMIMRGGVGAEQSAAALGAAVPTLLRAAADMLLARGKVPPAQYLYSLSQSQPDGWVARLGVFGRLHELSLYKQTGNVGSLGNAAITVKLLATLLKMATNSEQNFDMDVKFTTLSTTELSELACVSAAIGLWDVLPMFTVHRGHPSLMLAALKARNDMCRGAIDCLTNYTCLVPLMLEENAQWLFHFITGNCSKFDTAVLKNLCLWLNPLQDQLRPILRDLKQGITSLYSTRLLNLITTFVHVASEVEARAPRPPSRAAPPPPPDTWKGHPGAPRRALSAGLAHWAVVDDGNAKIMAADTPVVPELIGRVIDVACGRHHTLVLTENGVYSAGDNSYGQLGVGSSWAGAIGDSASSSGALLHVPYPWTAPLVAVSAGHYHSAAVDMGGRLYTWGWGVHGQLGLGSIDDECTPQLVTKLQGRKVLSVGCGACHTIVLLKSGEVHAMGAGVFGQLGGGARDKSSRPVRVPLPDPATDIAVGYFHNLALTTKGQVWIWGASPQQVRATHARRHASPTIDPPADPHLVPQLVDTRHVRGTVVQMSAGWHHSCIINNAGTLYTWGLNFDGQLGSGDRKQITIPTEVRIRSDAYQDSDKSGAKTPDKEVDDMKTRALAACGADCTVYIADDGRVFATGNTHINVNFEKDKGARVIMMKTTKRVIKIPASLQAKGNKFVFLPIDRVDIMFPYDIEGVERKVIDPRLNPLNTLEDFDKETWADDVIHLLKPWINEENLSANLNMASKLAYHNQSYSECLRLLLDNLKTEPRDEQIYLTHSFEEILQSDDHAGIIKTKSLITKKDEFKIAVTNIMSKRIKDVSLSILNEDPYPAVDPKLYESLPCGCDELKCLSTIVSESVTNISEKDLSSNAANVIDTCLSMFPIEPDLWETCCRISKNFYLENNLPIKDLETVLHKYMEANASTMASAIMYSNDCTQYNQILSPKFYLNMCSQVLDTWG